MAGVGIASPGDREAATLLLPAGGVAASVLMRCIAPSSLLASEQNHHRHDPSHL
jgi:hypothetical protein